MIKYWICYIQCIYPDFFCHIPVGRAPRNLFSTNQIGLAIPVSFLSEDIPMFHRSHFVSMMADAKFLGQKNRYSARNADGTMPIILILQG